MEPKVFKAVLCGSNIDDESASSIAYPSQFIMFIMAQLKYHSRIYPSEISLENINWDVEQKTKYQENTVLHVAAKSGNTRAAEKILERQPSLVLQQNKKLDTPLHIAARLGHVGVSTLLISHTITYAGTPESGIENPFQKVNLLKNTALHEAVRNGHHSIVKLLIEQDGNLTSLTNEARESPLFLAVERKFHTIALCILEKKPVSLSLQGRSGMTVMHAAVIGMPLQRYKFVEKLLKFLTDFFKRHLTVKVALERSMGLSIPINRQEDVLRELLAKCGSEILKKKDNFGWLPLHYAAHMGNVLVVKLFLTNNVDLAYEKVDDKDGMSALHIAAREGSTGSIGVIRTLVEECPDVCELLDNRDRTALHVAVESGNRNVVKTMINMPEFNDLINEQDKDGNTSLHLAAFHGTRHEILIMLATDRRVERAFLNKMGMTAVDIISSNTQLCQVDKAFIISMLEKYGYRPSLERRIVVRETILSVDENIEGHERSQETKQCLKMTAKYEAVDSGRGAANTGGENNKEKHHVTPDYDVGYNTSHEHVRNIATINLLVATIIASITFAAVVQIPGGYDSNGIAILRKNLAFKIFVIADSVAFGCAAASMFIHFAVALCSKLLRETYSYPVNGVMLLTIISIASSVLAFIMGSNMVLTGSSIGGKFDAGLPLYVVSVCFLIPIFYFLLRLITVGFLLVPHVYIIIWNLGMAIENAADRYIIFHVLKLAFRPVLKLWFRFFSFH